MEKIFSSIFKLVLPAKCSPNMKTRRSETFERRVTSFVIRITPNVFKNISVHKLFVSHSSSPFMRN